MIDLFPGAPFKDIVVIDYETRWSKKDYTLSSMTTEEYIRDPRFKAFGASLLRLSDNAPKAQWYRGDELPRILGTFDWSKTAVCAHNAQFDVSIMEWVHGVHPCFIFDTLSMARALYGVEVGNSLKLLVNRFGLPPKGNAVHDTDGLEELTPEIERELAEYCNHDTWLAAQLFGKMLMRVNPETGAVGGMFPLKELRLIDMTLKMYTRPQLELDPKLLEEALDNERTTRESLLARLKVTDADLASTDRFGALLRGLGVEPPVKRSPTNRDKWIPALAKTDAKFQAMLNGDNEDVAALCEARLKVKSVTERTRAQRFLDISKRGRLAVPLSYYGASTGRWTASKGAAINMQNLKRGSFLRKAIMAPEGHVLVVGDLSQIEPRVLAWLSGYEELLNIFRSGQDPYAMFGRQMFNKPDLTKESDPSLRQSAKSALLGAGYMLGWASFAQQLLTGFLGAPPMRYDRAFAKTLGVTGPWAAKFLGYHKNIEKLDNIQANCSPEELVVHCMAAARIIEIYRETAYPVAAFWKLMGRMLEQCLYGGDEVVYKCLTFRKEEIVLPSGMTIRYPNLRLQKDEEGRAMYVYGPDDTKLHAGIITNNCIAEGTEVLTSRGWVPIENVTLQDRVHDGVDFVQHSGTIAKGVQGCLAVDGVLMTPDHEVLTDDGWTQASQLQRPYRPDLRHVDGALPRVLAQGGVVLGVPVPVRETGDEERRGCDEDASLGRAAELRVHDDASDVEIKADARHDEDSVLHCVAEHGLPLSQALASGVRELRRPGDSGVRALAEVRELQGRHAADVCARLRDRAQGQRRPLQPGELRVGDAATAKHEQAQHRTPGERTGAERGDRHWPHDDLLPPGARMERGRPAQNPLILKQVYDIVNAGPRTRFVVRGVEGPFIVHNCVQGVARVVMTDGMLRTSKRYFVAGTVHDEQIAVAPEDEAKEALAWVIEQMTKEPSYLPGIPLAADGGVHRRYGLAKG